MKKITYFIAVTFLVLSACKAGYDTTSRSEVPDPAHNSQNSVDWAGVYKGLIPCADCPGIVDEILLKEDLTYKRTMDYLERDSRFSEEGRFEWDETGGKIRLLEQGSTGAGGNWFRVGENRLIMLDTEGNPIENNIPAEMYVYQKMDLDHVIAEVLEIDRIKRQGHSPRRGGSPRSPYHLKERGHPGGWQHRMQQPDGNLQVV